MFSPVACDRRARYHGPSSASNMSEKHLLILGTGNRKKAVELAVLFEPLGLRLLTLADVPNAIEVVEDGEGESLPIRGGYGVADLASHEGR